MRLAIGFDLAIPAAERLALIQEELDGPLRQFGWEVGWARADQLRLILAAGIDRAQLERLTGELGGVCARLKPVPFRVAGLSLAPSEERPRLIVAGCEDEGGSLARLRGAVSELSAVTGSDSPCGAWEPRVRVGRLRSTRGAHPPAAILRSHLSASFGESEARSLCVWEVAPRTAKSRQPLLARFALGAARALV